MAARLLGAAVDLGEQMGLRLIRRAKRFVGRYDCHMLQAHLAAVTAFKSHGAKAASLSAFRRDHAKQEDSCDEASPGRGFERRQTLSIASMAHTPWASPEISTPSRIPQLLRP